MFKDGVLDFLIIIHIRRILTPSNKHFVRNMEEDFAVEEEDMGDIGIRAIPGKGFGIIALKHITPGALILEEEPIIKVRLSIDGSLEGSYDEQRIHFSSPCLDRDVDNLSEELRRQFYSLADSTTFEDDCSSKSNYGIIKTNSFSIVYNSRVFLGLFPLIARINHSCQPNCNHYWTTQDGKYTVRAVRNLEPGDEITISYMSPLQRDSFHTRDSRRKILRDEFGFHCKCSACDVDVESPEQMEIEAKRLRVMEIEQMWCKLAPSPRIAYKLAVEQFKYAQELDFQAGLLSYISLHCVEAAGMVIHYLPTSEDADSGRKCIQDYAEKAVKFGSTAYGSDSYETKIFKEILDSCRDLKPEDEDELAPSIQAAIAKLREMDEVNDDPIPNNEADSLV